MPSKPGVYLFLDAAKQIIYVGKAKDLKARVSSYFTSPSGLGPKTRLLVAHIDKIKIVLVESELESLLLEAYYIKKYRPHFNIRLTDDKSYPLIKIPIKEDYPPVVLARRMHDPAALYFGPYPSSGAVKTVLRTLRRAFPYQSVTNHPKRICLYHHLGLCPCPPVFATKELNKQYRKNIRDIIRVLEGKSQSVMKDLTKEMDKASRDENFEVASQLKKRINALKIITEPSHKPFEYDVNPNLRSDLRFQELRGLQNALRSQGLEVGELQRIECYDISNIQGTNATGSMVVLTDGEIDKSQYRKFKIHKDGKPNDFAMIAEVLMRRLTHTEWPTPDLIIADGGKGQLSSVLQAMDVRQKHIPLIGLAKREETIIIPTTQQFYDESRRTTLTQNKPRLYGNNEDNFIELSLPKDSPSLHLIQRTRDEAHRFAITYHRHLRSKKATS
ncbi:MAG TPA: GIY-YIG nuclease family protein [Patescibacteria group bacterium]|nr:GIY-YIG nuclease family protein [Patescibacteria group bacterium]